MAETSQPEEGFTQATKADPSAPVKNTTPIYEVGFHIVPTVGEDSLGAIVEKIRKAIGDVEFIAESYPQKMTLAYVIERAAGGKREKYSEAYFGWIKFAAERDGIPALEAKLLATNEVLRSLIIQTVREDIAMAPRRAVFTSDRLEGETIAAPKRAKEEGGPVSDAELDKSIEALTG